MFGVSDGDAKSKVRKLGDKASKLPGMYADPKQSSKIRDFVTKALSPAKQ